MNATNLIGTVALGCLGGIGGFFITSHYLSEPPKAFIVEKENGSKSNVRPVNLDGTLPMAPADFTVAAESSIHSVVHIGSTFKSQQPLTNDPIYNYFFRGAPQEQKATGSGVIISEDGYIVTNNHVIADASKIEVTLNNKKTYSAKLVGTDPGTDIAVLKIEETDLPAIILGNSEEVKIGEWVLAVGNPFNLTSTVTFLTRLTGTAKE